MSSDFAELLQCAFSVKKCSTFDGKNIWHKSYATALDNGSFAFMMKLGFKQNGLVIKKRVVGVSRKEQTVIFETKQAGYRP